MAFPFVMQPNPESAPPDAERAERAARLVAMLERWAGEKVSQEPDWDTDSEVVELVKAVIRASVSLSWPRNDELEPPYLVET